MRRSKILALIAIPLMLSGCSDTVREQVASRIAAPAWMIKRPITAEPFTLTAYERMHERGAPANIYIGGDGAFPINEDSSPYNPVALHLAAHDKSDNVAYIARPCQFSGMADADAQCDAAYGKERSFAPEVINAYNTALDGMKRRYSLSEFNLIGYDGGAAIAALLAAQREDVASLRSVAGNLDPAAKNAYDKIPAWEESLTPIDYANSLKFVPQMHFIGGQDNDIPPAILHSYLQALGDSKCVEYKLIQEAEHDSGWTDKWPSLLRENIPACEAPPEPEQPAYEPPPEPIYYPRMSGDKK